MPKSDCSPPAARQAQPRASAPQSVRIIGGRWRKTRLPVLQVPGLRPTPDRVRETLFNWLGQDLSGCVCLDAFAGTGALGLEAASRHAAQVILLEQAASACTQLQTLIDKLQPGAHGSAVQLVRGDALSWLAQRANDAAPQGFDGLFLDPPFAFYADAAMTQRLLQAAVRALRPPRADEGASDGGWLYLEAPKAWTDAALGDLGLRLLRHLKAGEVHAHLLQRIA
jgi:16S rRNA (guanine966-N2)-methyltransferase